MNIRFMSTSRVSDARDPFIRLMAVLLMDNPTESFVRVSSEFRIAKRAGRVENLCRSVYK